MKRLITNVLILFVALAANAQQKVMVKCPECGHDICITISVDGTANVVSHDDSDIQTSNKQCLAITAKGTQCSRKAQEGSDYCWQHAGMKGKTPSQEDNTVSQSYSSSSTTGGQCRATTKSGRRCSRTARSNGYCWQHGG